MKERIGELMEQAGIYDFVVEAMGIDEEMEKFAQLIVQECKENFAKVWYEQGLDVRGAELNKFMLQFNEHFGIE